MEDDRKKQLELLKEGRLKGKKRSYLESESEDSDTISQRGKEEERREWRQFKFQQWEER